MLFLAPQTQSESRISTVIRNLCGSVPENERCKYSLRLQRHAYLLD